MLDVHSPVIQAQTIIRRVKDLIGTRLFGLGGAVDELLIALMAHGHILLEDVPGVGKTALARAFAETLGLSFRRIQCTPDLLPADIVGGLVFHPQNAEFTFRQGPIFANLLLVDEINRALPRTQSALLEAMAEGQVTVDGQPYRLPKPFMVIATQNPVESQGVFPLPEAQLDRFLLKTSLGYPSPEDDLAILSLHLGLGADVSRDVLTTPLSLDQDGDSADEVAGSAPKVPPWLALLDESVSRVTMSTDILQYISNLIRATRTRPDIVVGASPRAMILLAQAARAAAILSGRDFVSPDDVQHIATSVLFHRLILVGAADDSEIAPDTWMKSILKGVSVPIEGDPA